MSDPNATVPLPEHHRHEAGPTRNPYKVLFIVLAIIVGLALIAFLVWFLFLRGGGAPGPTPTPTPTQTTPSPTPTQTVTPPPLAGPCTTDNSSVELGTPDGAAGTTNVSIIFTNTGSADCTLEGFPTVEFVAGADGTQVGATATQDTSTSPTLVTLAPGGMAAALLSITTAGNVCEPVQVDGFRVIPPGSVDAFFIPTTDYPACDDPNTELLKVTAIAPV
jgi:hypothetical protein